VAQGRESRLSIWARASAQDDPGLTAAAARARRPDLLAPLGFGALRTWRVRLQGSQQLSHDHCPLVGRKLERFPDDPIGITGHGASLPRQLVTEKNAGLPASLTPRVCKSRPSEPAPGVQTSPAGGSRFQNLIYGLRYHILFFAMPRATPIRREKVIDEHGNILELAIWKVPSTGLNPAGIRYRLALVRRGERTPVVLYDWHAPKGHHRHVEGVEDAYHFVDVDQLLADFTADVRRITGDPTWPRL
jgi:Family of unknown function (DUF6516)